MCSSDLRKLRGNEKMIYDKTIRTYSLATPNLEDEIHLKGVRFVTSQFFKNAQACIHSSASCFIAFKILF